MKQTSGLGCAIFEIHADFPLFDTFLTSSNDILRQTVEMLRRPPDPWRDAFEDRYLWFEEDGQPTSEVEQEHVGISRKSSIILKLLELCRELMHRLDRKGG